MTAPHPAQWSQPVLDAIADWFYENPPAGEPLILDPFAGVGLARLRAAVGEGHEVLGVELEPEWIPDGVDGYRQGSALDLPFPDHHFDFVITSPAYGNRMADSHDAKDACKTCDGRGTITPQGEGPQPITRCRTCGGTGLSKRNTYRHSLGRMPSDGSSTTLQWGPAYRTFHEQAWREAARVLKPGGMAIVNVKNHIRDGREKHVVEWHLNAWTLLGATVHHVERVRTPGQRNGANGDLRLDAELLLFLQTTPREP